MATTSQKHAELKKLSSEVKQNIYQMLKLTDEILRDPEYVDQFGGESQLIEHFEKNEYGHFGGQPSLASMLRAYRANPKKATWQEYHFNLRVMIDLATPERQKAEGERVNWKARCGELDLKVEQLSESLAEARTLNSELKQRCESLVVENAEMRGRLKYVEEHVRVA